MLDKLQALMEERNLTKADVAKGAGVPYTTVDGWFKKGFENVRFPQVKKLAAFLDVSMEFLINDDETNKNNGKVMIIDSSMEEYRLILLWRQLPRDEQMKMLGRIEAKVEEYSKGEQ